MTINAFKSEVELYPSSQFIVESQNDRFVPSAILNGSWSLNSSKAQMQGFTFQSLTIGTQAPYFTSGLFSLTQDTSKLMLFPISVNSVGITQTSTNDLAFTVGLGLNLGGSGVNFSVNTTVRVISQQGVTNSRKLEYDRFEVDNIAFDLATNALMKNYERNSLTPFSLSSSNSTVKVEPVEVLPLTTIILLRSKFIRSMKLSRITTQSC